MKRSKKIAALVLSALSFIQSMPNPQAMFRSPSVSTTQSASTMERFEQMILSAIKHGSVNAIICVYGRLCCLQNVSYLNVFFKLVIESGNVLFIHTLYDIIVICAYASTPPALFESIVESTDQANLRAFITAVTASGTDEDAARMFEAMGPSSPRSRELTSTWADIAVNLLTASDTRQQTSCPCAKTAVAESPGPNSDRNVPFPPARATADTDGPTSAASLGFTIVDAVPSIAPAVPTVNKPPLPTETAGEYVAAGYADGDDNDDDGASEATPASQSAQTCKRLSDAPAASESKRPRIASNTPPRQQPRRPSREEERKWFGVPSPGARSAHCRQWISKRDDVKNQTLKAGVSKMISLVRSWHKTVGLTDACANVAVTGVDDNLAATENYFGALRMSIRWLLRLFISHYRNPTVPVTMDSARKGLLLVRDFNRTLYQYDLIHKCQDSPAGSASFITALSNFRTTLKAVVIQRLGENFWNDLITRSDEKQEEKEEEKDPATPPSPPAVDTNFLD